MMPLTKKGYESNLNKINSHTCKKKLNRLMIKIIVKLKTIVIIQINTEVLHNHM